MQERGDRAHRWVSDLEAGARPFEDSRREQADELRGLRVQHVQQALALTDSLKAKIDQMLRMPLIEQRIVTRIQTDPVSGRVYETAITIIEPARWSFGTALAFVATWDKLGRAALGMTSTGVRMHEATDAHRTFDDELYEEAQRVAERLSLVVSRTVTADEVMHQYQVAESEEVGHLVVARREARLRQLVTHRP
jgi:hypothetical protein